MLTYNHCTTTRQTFIKAVFLKQKPQQCVGILALSIGWYSSEEILTDTENKCPPSILRLKLLLVNQATNDSLTGIGEQSFKQQHNRLYKTGENKETKKS